MADVKKTVEIALKIVGADTKSLKTVLSAFESITKAVDATTASVTKLQQTLNKITVPKSFDTFVTSLKTLNQIKAPNLDKIAVGFQKLGAIAESGKIPDLKPFATQLKTLQGIKLPNLGQIATGFKTILNTNLSAFASKIGILEKGLQRLGAINLDKLSSTLRNLNKINLTKVAGDIKRVDTAMKQSGETAQVAESRFGSFGDKLRTVFQFRLISAGLMAVNNAITQGITAIIEYDQALKDLQAITGATALEVAQMGAKILEVASTTKFSASEVAAGMRTIGQAGFSASEAVETMQAVSDLATGTLSDMSTTVDLVTTAMRVFRIDASQSAEVADVFANAVNRSKLTIDKLRTAMNYVGPIARDSGVSFKELAASMGTLANSGLRASTIGTGLRRVFAELIDPSKKLRAAVAESGVALADLDPRVNSLQSVLSNLGVVVNDASVAFDVFGKRGASAVLALTSEGSKFQSMLTTIGQSGTAALQASIQMEGLGVSFKNMRDKAGLLAIAIGNAGVGKAMKIFVDVVRVLIDALTYLVDTTFGKVVVGLLLITATLGTVTAAFKLLKTEAAVSAMVTGVLTLGAAFETLTLAVTGATTALAFTGVGLAIAAVVAAVTGLVWWLGRAKKAAEETAKVSDKYKQLTKDVEDYALKTATLTKNSEEFNEANKNLRDGLFDTARNFEDMSTEALAAGLSIDPLTGKIKDGGVAIDAYNKKLEEMNLQKLIEANEALNAAFAETNVASDPFILFNPDKGKDQLTHYQKMQEAVARMNDETGKASSADKERQASLAAIDLQASKNITTMEKMGNVNVHDTVENFKRLAGEIGGTDSVLESMVQQFEKLKKANQASPSNLIDIWAKQGEKSMSDLIDQYAALVKEFDESKDPFEATSKEDILGIEAAQASLKLKQDILEKETAQMIANGKDKAVIHNRYIAIKEALDEEAALLNKKIVESEVAQNLIALGRINKAREDSMAKAIATYKKGSKALAVEVSKINKEFEKSAAIVGEGGQIDYAEEEKAYKKHLKDLEAAKKQNLVELSLLEAQGAEGIPAEKLAVEEKFYADRLKAANDFYAKVRRGEDETGENTKKGLAVIKEVEDKNYQERTKKLLEGYKAEADVKKKLSKLDDDFIKEQKKYANNLTDITDKSAKERLKIEENYASKQLKIAEDTAAAKKKLEEDLTKNKQANIQDEYDLSLNAEDLIRGVKERTLSEDDKLASQRAAALAKIAEGRELIRQGDEVSVQNGKELLKDALGMVSAFKDQSKAISVIRDVTSELKNVSGIEKQLADQKVLTKAKEEQAKRDKKLIEAKQDYDTKLTNATNVITKITAKEEERHRIEMQNQLKELGVYLLKLKAAQALIRLSGETPDTTISDELADKINIENDALDENIRLLEKSKQEKIAMEEANKRIVESYDQITSSRDEKGILTFTNAAATANKGLEKSYEDVATTATKTSQEIARVSESIKETDLGDIAPEEEEVARVDQLKDSLVEISLTDKVFDIVVNAEAGKDAVDGLIKKLKTLRDLAKKPIVIKTETSGSSDANKFAGGGRLPGFGGGDKNMSLLEDGEWVINKFAVRKFGDSFMNSINNMTLPKFANGGPAKAVVSSAVKTGSSMLGALSNFGTVQLETGKVKVPAIVHKDVVSELTSHLTKMNLMGVNR